MDTDSFQGGCGCLIALRREGIEVEVDGGNLRCRPRLPDTLRPRVKAYKEAIISLLSGDESEAFVSALPSPFAAGGIYPIRSRALGSTVVFVPNDEMAALAYRAGIVPYTDAELRTVARGGREAMMMIQEAKLRLIHETKAIFEGWIETAS